ncbi:hypothetical protein, partial [Neisseria sicca]|uniref:hypothetical protein n=1 Tax=Neisseria sicca TaxID=490 RepID=UPI001C990DF2
GLGSIDGDFGLVDGRVEVGKVGVRGREGMVGGLEMVFGGGVLVGERGVGVVFVVGGVEGNLGRKEFGVIGLEVGFLGIEGVEVSGRIDLGNEMGVFKVLWELEVEVVNLGGRLGGDGE